MKKILVTGGAGFIGLNFVKYLQTHTSYDMHVIDKFTYASNQHELINTKVPFTTVDIADREQVTKFFENNTVDAIIHFAAESHVDNSIKDCMPFVHSNITGTINLLDMAVKYNVQRFIHISTDEVFGSLGSTGHFTEQSPITPRNPYSASKAAAEHFVQAYGNTYKLPYIIVNSSNNYGPWQHHEKLIPLTVKKIMDGKKIPVYGKGDQIRDWIYVEDTCAAVHRIFTDGVLGNRYCIGGNNEVKNLDLVKMIISKMNSPDLVEFVTDRLGHDTRYSTDISKIKNDLEWEPKWELSTGLDVTIEWMKNENRI